jgi:hypothetical protein
VHLFVAPAGGDIGAVVFLAGHKVEDRLFALEKHSLLSIPAPGAANFSHWPTSDK